MPGNYVEIEVAALGRATENAQLIETKDGRDIWIPLSQVGAIHRSEPPSIEIEKWLAEKEDLL